MTEQANDAEQNPEDNSVEQNVLNQELNSDESAAATETSSEKPELDMVLDIDVDLSIELGSKLMKLSDLLQLSKNSIIELDKPAGEPLDIKVNGALIARGEVVVVNGKYGIRLSEIVSKSKRLENI